MPFATSATAGTAGDQGASGHRAVRVVVLGTFVVALDVSLIITGLPAIGEDLGNGGTLNWVPLAYLLAVAIAQAPSNWIASRLGRMSAFSFTLGVFAVGALVGAAAPGVEVLVVARVVQGLGAGAVFPIGLAVIHDAVEEGRRGGALGWWGASTMVAPALAPVLAGTVILGSHWRILFVLDLVVGGLAAAWAWRIRPAHHERTLHAFDAAGFALASVGMGLLLVGLDSAGQGSMSTVLVGSLVLSGVVVLAVFLRHELMTEHPLLDIRMFRLRLFSLSIALVWLMAAVQYARIFVVPLELQSVFGLTPFEAGAVLVPAGLATAVTMRLGGRVSDVLGPRLPVLVGLGLSGVGAWGLATVELATPIGWIVAILLVQGLGVGVSMLPVMVVSLAAVPGRLVGQAAAVNSINRQIAGVLAVAVMASMVSMSAGSLVAADIDPSVALAAYRPAFWLVVVTLGLAVPAAVALPGRLTSTRSTVKAESEDAAR